MAVDTILLDGKGLARRLREGMKRRVEALAELGIVPGLAIVIVGEDPASRAYVRNKHRYCRKVGVRCEDHELPASTTMDELCALLDRLNEDPDVHGVIVQQPLPAGLDARAAAARVAPHKDVDCFNPDNLGRLLCGWSGVPAPCTPRGVVRLLEEYEYPFEGRTAVVVGRSTVVGKPLALMLLERNMTVTICHSRTRDLAAHTAAADLVIAAAGRPALIRADMLHEGAWVIDVGINEGPGGRIVGDVDAASCMGVAGALSPVPGGVGPMTIAMLVENVIESAEKAARENRGEKERRG